MKKNVLFIIMLLFSIVVYSQREIKVVKPIEHSGSVPAKGCPNDAWGIPCAKIKIIAPQQQLSFNADDGYIINQKKAIGGYELFVSTHNPKKHISINEEGNKPLKIDLACNDAKLIPREAYSLYLEVGEDINAGKAYVTFQSNKNKNYIVLIDGKEYKSDEKGEIVLQLPYGTYNYTTKATDHEDKVGNIVLIDKPQYEDANLAMQQGILKITTDTLKNIKIYVDGILQKDSSPLLDVGTHKVVTELIDSTYSKTIRLNKEGMDIDMHITGNLKVNTLNKARVFIWPEGNSIAPSQHEYNGNVNLNMLGQYKIGVWKRGYHEMIKDINIPIRSKITKDFALKRKVVKQVFIEYSYSPDAPLGGTIGYANRLGWYISLRGTQKGYSYLNKSGNDEADGSSYGKAIELKDDEKLSSDDKDKHYQIELAGGLLFAINRWFYLFGGIGYGESGDFYRPLSKYYLKKDNTGLLTEGGMKLKVGFISMTCGVKKLFGNKNNVEPVLGIGFALGELFESKCPFK